MIAYVVHYTTKLGTEDYAIFRDLHRAEDFAAANHGWIGGLVEVALHDKA